ncbi:GntR family transcriptional regulator [Ruicaihuangia caeni]|uniref:GntR family transcriptional regulator n=1 Tax=Ruicaihuangia caeni TaxID=3042517 RepID=UPI00338EAEBE
MREAILAMIKEQGLQAGDRLDTEAQLTKRTGASRSTVRDALKSLEQDGTIGVVHGHGWFVSAIGSLHVERPVTRYESVTEMLESRGYSVTSAVLDVQESAASAKEAAALAVDEGTPVIRLTRIRYGNDEPMAMSLNVVLRSALPGPLNHRDWSGSLSRALEAHGHHIVSSAARITAAELPRDVEDRYSLGGLGPWMLVEETCLSRSGLRTIYAEEYFRGGEIAFSVLRRR